MKKLLFTFFVSVFVILSFLSCTNDKKENNEDSSMFLSSLTANDTLVVKTLGDQFFGLIKEGSFDQAFIILSELDDENRLAYLTEETKEKLIATFSLSKIKGHELIDLQFNSPFNNFSRYIIYSGDDEESNSFFRFALSPVKVNNGWHLTIRIAPNK